MDGERAGPEDSRVDVAGDCGKIGTEADREERSWTWLSGCKTRHRSCTSGGVAAAGMHVVALQVAAWKPQVTALQVTSWKLQMVEQAMDVRQGCPNLFH